LLVLLAAGCATVPRDAAEIPGISRVDETYRGPSQVQRLTRQSPEEEAEGMDVVLRTDKASRIGYHFFIALDHGFEPPAGSKVRLQVVAKEGEAAKVRTFDLPRNPGWWFGEIVVALTGGDAPTPGWKPLAWRVSILGPDGKELAVRRSFLWGMPTDTGLGK
jgi:hypothetical protein